MSNNLRNPNQEKGEGVKPFYINISKNIFVTVHKTQQISDQVNIDWSKDGDVLGIEILDWKSIDFANESLRLDNIEAAP